MRSDSEKGYRALEVFRYKDSGLGLGREIDQLRTERNEYREQNAALLKRVEELEKPCECIDHHLQLFQFCPYCGHKVTP